jgi:site-specific recombinase XerC
MSEAVALLPEPRHPLEPLRQLVVNSVRSPHSRRAYGKALDGFFAWYAEFPRAPFSKAVVAEYRTKLELDGLAASTINVRLAALRKLTAEAADNGLLDPVLAAGIGKVRGARQLGTRAGNWLTRAYTNVLAMSRKVDRTPTHGSSR